jgi:hypothetical protein
MRKLTAKSPVRALMLVLCLSLAGCFENQQLSDAGDRGLQPTSGPARIAVLNQSVSIAGPAGYCVDVEATRESDIEAFALLVRCRGTLRPAPVLSATITSLRAPADDLAALHRLAEFLPSPAGRAQLSRSGDPDDVTVQQMTYADGVIWMLIEDRGNPASFDNTYWRAILPVAGRIVTLSVLSAREHPVEQGSGLSVLRSFVMRMRAVNSG